MPPPIPSDCREIRGQTFDQQATDSGRAKSAPPERACKSCGGTGWRLAHNSMFTADGFSRLQCHACNGSKVQPVGYVGWHEDNADQRRFRLVVAEWGGLKPPAALSGGAASATGDASFAERLTPNTPTPDRTRGK